MLSLRAPKELRPEEGLEAAVLEQGLESGVRHARERCTGGAVDVSLGESADGMRVVRCEGTFFE